MVELNRIFIICLLLINCSIITTLKGGDEEEPMKVTICPRLVPDLKKEAPAASQVEVLNTQPMPEAPTIEIISLALIIKSTPFKISRVLYFL